MARLLHGFKSTRGYYKATGGLDRSWAWPDAEEIRSLVNRLYGSKPPLFLFVESSEYEAARGRLNELLEKKCLVLE